MILRDHMSSLIKPINLVRIETFRHLEPKYHSLLIKLTENYLYLVLFTFQTDQKPQFVAGVDLWKPGKSHEKSAGNWTTYYAT